MALATLRPTMAQLESLAWRAGWTALQAFLGALTAAGLGVVDLDVAGAAAIAGLGGALSVVKSFASQRLGTGSE